MARGFFPRRRWPTVFGIVCAGTLADVDLLSAFFGPATYFAARRTFTHSLVGFIVIVVLSVLIARYSGKRQPEFFSALLLPVAAAAAVHLLLDLSQSEGVAVLWPFSSVRLAVNWLPSIDPWIMAIFVTGICVPELFHLITSEIGVKDKTPRGRNGSLIAFAVIVAYLGARGFLHFSSATLLDPHSYGGESARRVDAFPDALSLLTWHGVVETQSLLCLVDVPVGPGKNFDPEIADCLHKPEVSLELDAAQKTDVAREYVRALPFPRAAVAKTSDGYEVVIRSMRDAAEHETRHRLAARILLDRRFGITSEELVWLSEVRLR